MTGRHARIGGARRWALEKFGQDYAVRSEPLSGPKQPQHLRRQPFGQIPVYEVDDLVLFEAGETPKGMF